MEKTIRAVIGIIESAIAASETGDPINAVKGVYFGDPVLIPESMLPAIAVVPVTQTVNARGSTYDESDSVIKVRLVQNLKDYLGGNASDPKTVKLVENGVRIMAGRNAQGKLSELSVAGALRRNPWLPLDGAETCNWNGNYSIEYGFTDNRGYVAMESVLTFTSKTLSDRN